MRGKKILSSAFFVFAATCLLLLGACGEKEPEAVQATPAVEATAEPLPDARELWREADEIMGGWDCVDMDVSTVVDTDFQGIVTTFIDETRIKGTGLQGEEPVYQAVSTGDMASELYYNDECLYVSGAFGNYRMKATLEELTDYLSEGTLEFAPESFEDVQLVSHEGGYKLAFSEPRESFREGFLDSLLESGMSCKEGSLEVVGGITLREDGSYDSMSMDVNAVFLLEEQEIGVHARAKQKILSHEDLRIALPSKLEGYTECKDVKAPETLYTAFAALESVYHADYTAEFCFDGIMEGVTAARSEQEHAYVRIDPMSGAARYYSDWVISYNGQERERYCVDYNGAKVTYEREEYTEELDIKPEDIWLALLGDFYAYCTTADVPYYTDMVSSSGDGGTEITFTPSPAFCAALLEYAMNANMSYESLETFREDSTCVVESGSGKVLLDESGALKSIELTATLCRTAVNGEEVSGTLTYKKVFNAFDDAVVFPGQEEAEEMQAM